MTDDIATLFAYNRWADLRILEACRKLTPEQLAAEPVPGWSSVRTSLVHIAAATDGWLRAVSGESVQTSQTEADLPSVEHIEALLDRAYGNFETLAPTLTPELLAAERTFSGRSRTAVLPLWAALRHVVNHSTYHRGQVAAKLKRLGIEPPMTDLVFWIMEQSQATS
jgi:uncharacterized damage-inducible protein DinB